MSKLSNAVSVMKKVFEDMDKDFTIWEYREEIKELLDASEEYLYTLQAMKDPTKINVEG